jgi:hypothetical protein
VTPQNALEDYASPSQIEVPDNINHETASVLLQECFCVS